MINAGFVFSFLLLNLLFLYHSRKIGSEIQLAADLHVATDEIMLGDATVDDITSKSTGIQTGRHRQTDGQRGTHGGHIQGFKQRLMYTHTHTHTHTHTNSVKYNI